MSSAGHCGRHERYRCGWCEANHKETYHDDVMDLDKRIAELEIENTTLTCQLQWSNESRDKYSKRADELEAENEHLKACADLANDISDYNNRSI